MGIPREQTVLLPESIDDYIAPESPVRFIDAFVSTLTREQNEGFMEAMAARVKQNPRIMKQRKALVEHPFGTIKRGMGMSYFLCKGMEAVRAEMSLTVLAYNLKRVLNLLNFAELMQAVAAKS